MVDAVTVLGIDHVNIDTQCLDETVGFYCDVLGLVSRPKPSGNPGVWLYIGEDAIVHVNLVDDGETTPGTGRFNHVAFEAVDAASLATALESAGHDFRMVTREYLGITQIFTTDPNGILVELNITDLRGQGRPAHCTCGSVVSRH